MEWLKILFDKFKITEFLFTITIISILLWVLILFQFCPSQIKSWINKNIHWVVICIIFGPIYYFLCELKNIRKRISNWLNKKKIKKQVLGLNKEEEKNLFSMVYHNKRIRLVGLDRKRENSLRDLCMKNLVEQSDFEFYLSNKVVSAVVKDCIKIKKFKDYYKIENGGLFS